MNQQKLWHEDIYDALRASVDALGGTKRVGHALWPAKTIEEAGKLAAHFGQVGGYKFVPVSPEDEHAELQRQFIRSVEEQKALVERMQRVQVRAAS